jgi:CrcB protein
VPVFFQKIHPLLWVGLGGAAGSIMRYALAKYVDERVTGSVSLGRLGDFPFGTLLVNVLGALAIGLLFALFEEKLISPETRLLTMVGVLGGFTTFSTFSLETVNLAVRDGQWGLALLNVGASNILCLAMTLAGLFAGRGVIGLMR